ncbi:hypothetical protein PENTCL1PPCAC_13325, partial [Pristionchus entomophagus]
FQPSNGPVSVWCLADSVVGRRFVRLPVHSQERSIDRRPPLADPRIRPNSRQGGEHAAMWQTGRSCSGRRRRRGGGEHAAAAARPRHDAHYGEGAAEDPPPEDGRREAQEDDRRAAAAAGHAHLLVSRLRPLPRPRPLLWRSIIDPPHL